MKIDRTLSQKKGIYSEMCHSVAGEGSGDAQLHLHILKSVTRMDVQLYDTGNEPVDQQSLLT